MNQLLATSLTENYKQPESNCRTNRWYNDPLIAPLWDGTTHTGCSYARCPRQSSQRGGCGRTSAGG